MLFRSKLCLEYVGWETVSDLFVPQDGSLLQLVKQTVLFSDSTPALTQNALLVCAQVDLQVPLLGGPVVAVRTLERFLAGVCAHVQRQDAVETEALAAQRARVLPVLAVVFLRTGRLGWDARGVLSPQEGREVNSPVHTIQNPGVQELIG